MAEAPEPTVEPLVDDYFAARHGAASKLDVLSKTFTCRHPFGEVQGSDEVRRFFATGEEVNDS